MNITVKVETTKPLAQLPDPARLNKAAAIAVSALVRNHFLERNSATPARPGWPRTGFWGAAAEATEWEADAGSAVITIKHPGVRLRFLGGIVRPKPGRKMLALPLRPEFAGVNPREKWPDKKGGFVWQSPNKKLFLAFRDGAGILRLAYHLVARTTHRPDPSVLPTPSRIEAAAKTAQQRIIDRAIKQKGN